MTATVRATITPPPFVSSQTGNLFQLWSDVSETFSSVEKNVKEVKRLPLRLRMAKPGLSGRKTRPPEK
jgi:hypothetical protein